MSNEKAAKTEKTEKKLAAILIRGLIRVKKDTKTALKTIRLQKKHTCTIIPDTKSNRAILTKCNTYLTYGEVTEETIKTLTSKRGKKNSKGEMKKYFPLNSPKGGFERKGIKKPFKKGGALGYRGNKINDLIKKML